MWRWGPGWWIFSSRTSEATTEARNRRRKILGQVSEGAPARQHLAFRLASSRTETIHLCCFRPPGVCSLLRQVLGNEHSVSQTQSPRKVGTLFFLTVASQVLPQGLEHCSIAQVLSCVWHFCDPMDYSPLGFSVHRIFQARILEWAAISFSRGSSPPRDQTHISCVSSLAGRFFTT